MTRAGAVGYCISVQDRRQNPDVLYYFHGADAPVMFNARLDRPWRHGTAAVMQLWNGSDRPPPTIISISWGPTWILKDDKLVAFRDELIPRLEARFIRPQVRRRMVLGGSMGGLNAFLAWAQMPEMLSAAAFQCPAFTRFSPFSDKSARGKEIARIASMLELELPQGAKLINAGLDILSQAFRPHFTSTEEWLEYQPEALMKRDARRRLPAAYMVYDAFDEYGFDGAPAIAAAGQPITYERIDGGHCRGIMTPGLAAFLSNPEANGQRD